MTATAKHNHAAPCLTGRLIEVALGYQQMLAANPRHPQALVGMCLVALASSQTEAAIQMAAAAVAVAPTFGHAWVALGHALNAAGQRQKAEQAYGQAIRLDGMNEFAHLGLGDLSLTVGHPEEAMRHYELVLDRKPALVPAHLGLGNALALLGRNQEALACYQKALSLKPGQPEAEFASGFVLARLGRTQEAEARYRRALVERPDFAAAWLNLGALLREQGREAYAEAALLRCVQLRPDLIGGWINLAILERERRRPAQAAAYLRTAFAVNPDQVETHLAWCQFRAAENDLAGAWGWLSWALARDPDQPEALNMQGILLHAERHFSEAIAAFARAESLGHLAASSNRGNTLLDMGRMIEALIAQETAVERDPTHPGARYNLALTRLRLGDWERGWPGYEARWRFREVHRTPRVFTQPRWQGEPLHGPEGGRRILLHAEQGLGDTIQFCRYATLVAARGGHVILQVQPAVERLLRSLAVVRSGQAEVALLGASLPAFDLECPLLSLPAVFATTLETVPSPGIYLNAEPAAVSAKHKQFPDVRPGARLRRIGIAWAGNPRYKADAQRSIALETLLPLLRVTDITWISLQKGPAAEQLTALKDELFVWDGSSADADLAETAALLATLDLVITTDTCIAHLAGAMAKPVWILLPHLSDWRWMQRIETTPWYPTARLLRQRTPGDWSGVVYRVLRDLLALRQPAESVFNPAHALHASVRSFLHLSN